MNKLLPGVVLVLFGLAGCGAGLTEAEVQDIQRDADVVRYDGASVTVSSYYDEIGDGYGQSKDALPEAARVCALAGKRPEFIGVHEAATPTPNVWSGMAYKHEFEFACV